MLRRCLTCWNHAPTAAVALVIAGGAGLLAVLVAWGEIDSWGVFLRFLYHVP